jgi:hypothetical protein
MQKLWIILVLPLMWSCTEPDDIGCSVPCEVVLMLSQDAIEFISPYQGVDRVVYKDSLSQELVFDLIRFGDMCQTNVIETGTVCDIDTTMVRPQIITLDECNIKLRAEDKDYEINITLEHWWSVHLDCSGHVAQDRLTVFINPLEDTLPNTASLDHHIVSWVSWESKMIDSVTLNGSVFTDVIVDAIWERWRQPEAYYNKELGLVGFREEDSGKVYSFVRFE